MPRAKWTSECPEYLANIDESDRRQLSLWDDEYKVQSWEEVTEIIRTDISSVRLQLPAYLLMLLAGSNRLESFKRLPSQLHEYRRHMGILKAEHGSVMGFILKNRVQWNDLTAKGQPFEYEGRSTPVFPQVLKSPSLRPGVEDMRILLNDWPYGIDPKIVHIVVWTKFSFEEESSTGDLTADARKQIDAFIGTTFRKAMNPEHVSLYIHHDIV